MLNKTQINVFFSELCVLSDYYKGHAQYNMYIHLIKL